MMVLKNDLEKWRQQLESNVVSDQHELLVIQQRLRDNTARLEHVNALLGVTHTKSINDDLMVAIEQILRASSEPMHVKVLAQKLTDIGVPLPGRGTIANLTTRLHRSSNYKRVGRGTYIPV
jgi:hypothetical protein